MVYIRYSKLFWIYIKKLKEKANNHSIRIWVNKIEIKITFKIRTGYYKLLTYKAMKILRSTKSKITKNENGEVTKY